MKTSSAKAKGRRLQTEVAGALCRELRLHADDVKCAIMGESGRDIHLSPRAQMVWPYSVECKNTERLNVWQAIEQAAKNADVLTPLVIFRRNRSETYAVLPFDTLLDLHKELEQLRMREVELMHDLGSALGR